MKKVDANRERGEATFGEEVSEIVYNLYHNNISTGISMFGGEPGIVFDIHGYSDENENRLALLGNDSNQIFLMPFSDHVIIEVLTVNDKQ